MHFGGEIIKFWIQITQVTRKLCFPMYWMTQLAFWSKANYGVWGLEGLSPRQTSMMPSLVTECESVNKTQQGYCRRLLFCCSSKIRIVKYNSTKHLLNTFILSRHVSSFIWGEIDWRDIIGTECSVAGPWPTCMMSDDIPTTHFHSEMCIIHPVHDMVEACSSFIVCNC